MNKHKYYAIDIVENINRINFLDADNFWRILDEACDNDSHISSILYNLNRNHFGLYLAVSIFASDIINTKEWLKKHLQFVEPVSHECQSQGLIQIYNYLFNQVFENKFKSEQLIARMFNISYNNLSKTAHSIFITSLKQEHEKYTKLREKLKIAFYKLFLKSLENNNIRNHFKHYFFKFAFANPIGFCDDKQHLFKNIIAIPKNEYSEYYSIFNTIIDDECNIVDINIEQVSLIETKKIFLQKNKIFAEINPATQLCYAYIMPNDIIDWAKYISEDFIIFSVDNNIIENKLKKEIFKIDNITSISPFQFQTNSENIVITTIMTNENKNYNIRWPDVSLIDTNASSLTTYVFNNNFYIQIK